MSVAVRLATRTWGDGVGAGELTVAADSRAATGAGIGTRGAGPAGSGGRVGVTAEAPLALLIHGVTSSSRTWWRLAPELVRQGFRVLAVDLRGHGASPRVGEGLVLGDLSADVLETLRLNGQRPTADGHAGPAGAGVEGRAGPAGAGQEGHAGPARAGQEPSGAGRALDLGGGRAAIDLVVGHSLGALVALDLLAKTPGLARRLVLEEPAGPSGIDWEVMAEGIAADGRRARNQPEAMRRELVSSNPAWDPVEVDRRLADLTACDSDGVAAALRRTTAFDLVGLASAVRIPTLLLVGLEDLGSALVGPDRIALVDALAGRGVFEVLDEGHNLHREAFSRFMDVLDRWLDATARVREA